MAISNTLVYVRYRFDLGGGPEIAVCGFHARYMGSATESGLADGIASWGWRGFQGQMAARAARFSSGVRLAEVACYILDPADKYHATDKGVALESTGETGWAGTAAYSLPWEAAPCVTLYGYTPGTYVKNHRRRTGRMYLPPPATGVIAATTGEMSNAAVDDLVSGVHAWIEAFNDIPTGLDSQVHAVVLSKMDVALYDVAHVKMDSRIDAQRRRERQQPITYANSYSLAP